MLHRDKVCRKCGWVTEWIFEIDKISHYYCSNCHMQSRGSNYELVTPALQMAEEAGE